MLANTLIFGCGYIGKKVAQVVLNQGQGIAAIVKTHQSQQHLTQWGIKVHVIDMDGLPSVSLETKNTQVYIFMPPPPQGVCDTRMTRILQFFEENGQPDRVVYLSTTGVYGDCQGQWIDENHPVNPQVDRAKRRWDAELQLQSWQAKQAKALMIIRVAGIYGAGKLPLARLEQGLPMVSEQDAPFTNRIHADDLVTICTTVMEKGVSGEIYHACDGQADTMTNYFNQIADKFGYERPMSISLAQAKTQLSAGMLSYLRESRRLDNTKLQTLGITLAYPNLSSGLQQCWQEMQSNLPHD